MSFYITLPSTASKKIFPNNRPNQYKVRLPKQLFFQENDWEVGLSSISFPDVQTTLKADVFGKIPFGMNLIVPKNKHYNLKVERVMDDQPRVQDGTSLFNKMFNWIDFNYYFDLSPGTRWANADGKTNRPMFKWQERAGQQELLIDNTDVLDKGKVYIYMSLSFALAFHFIKVEKIKDAKTGQLKDVYDLDYGLHIEHYDKPTIPDPSPSKFWQTVFPGDKDFDTSRHDETEAYVKLTCWSNWRMTHINEHFIMNFGSPVKSLFVFCDANQTQVLGHQITSKIREVVFDAKGRGRVYFEPRHIEFLPIRKNVIDDIEVAMRETDGKLVDFLGGDVIVTLKFERRLNH